MPVVRAIKGRGVTGWVEVHGETLFTERGDVHQWNRRFSRRITRFTRQEAPTNKRPRWGHYGAPLKRTITSSSRADPASLKSHAAVGSTAPHAFYVDQGTGIYGGNGSYEAKILPPYSWQSPSLYEHTFRVPENFGEKGEPDIRWVPIGTIIIKGQKPQYFFDKGLTRAFGSEGMLSTRIPGVVPQMSQFPEMLANFVGNTPPTAAFRAQLEEWRQWRDRAWHQRRILGEGYVAERFRREFRDVKKSIEKGERAAITKAARAKESALRSKLYRLKQRSIKRALAAQRQRLAEIDALEKRRIQKAKRAADEARVKRQLASAIAAERAEFLQTAMSKYKGAGITLDLSGRRLHDGGYAYHLRVFRNGRTVIDDWFPSKYQAAL